jgi:transmembrane sensor
MGMSALITELERQALAWLVRVNDPAFEGWSEWEAWMAADPDRAEVYWRLATLEADSVEALRAIPVPSVRAMMSGPVRSSRTSGLPRRSALAAAVAVLALGGGWFAWNERPQPWVIQTAPGEIRTVTLTDGSSVSLAGGTRLTLDRKDPRNVTLDAGRALFEVVHDDAHPFVVEAGQATLTDLGTTFDVTRMGPDVRVAVSEGMVRVDAQDVTATLNPGEGVTATAGRLERRQVATEDVVGWREGRLSYSGETLAVVAQDLARALNRPIAVSPDVASRRFSGSLTTTDQADQRQRLSRLLGVSVAEDGAGWRLEP